MAKLNEEAQKYEPTTKKNIADLDKVSTSLELEDREDMDKDDKPYKFKVIVVDGEDYRVPGSVLGSLKAILEKKPDLEFFSVSKQGTGMDTKYTVIPM